MTNGAGDSLIDSRKQSHTQPCTYGIQLERSQIPVTLSSKCAIRQTQIENPNHSPALFQLPLTETVLISFLVSTVEWVEVWTHSRGERLLAANPVPPL